MTRRSIEQATILHEGQNLRSRSGQPCPSCGAPREPGVRFCTACGAPLETPTTDEVAVPPVVVGPARSANSPSANSPSANSPSANSPSANSPSTGSPSANLQRDRTLECSGCGSFITITDDQRSYSCPFCDSAFVAELPTLGTGRRRPEFILGFTVTPEQAREAFVKWIGKNSWLRPGDLARRAITDKQRGVYLPFWHFAMRAQSRWSAEIGEHWYETEYYTVKDSEGKTHRRSRQVLRTEWFPLGGAFERFHFGHLIPATAGITAEEARQIGPFPLSVLTRYRPYFLAGWMCEEYSTTPDAAAQQCKTEFENRQQREIGGFLPGDTQRGLSVNTEIESLESDLVLLPVYVLSYRYRGKQFRFLLNGTNGKVIGEKPWSSGRIAAVVIVVLAILVSVAVAAMLAAS